MEYIHESEQFAFSNDAIHLLRNGFNYKTHEFEKILSITIEKGKTVNNWLLLLMLGLSMVSFSFFYLKSIYEFYFDPSAMGRIYIEEILAGILLLFFGGYFVFASIKKGPVMIVNFVDGKKKKLVLVKEKKNWNDFVSVIETIDKLKFKINIENNLKNILINE